MKLSYICTPCLLSVNYSKTKKNKKINAFDIVIDYK